MKQGANDYIIKPVQSGRPGTYDLKGCRAQATGFRKHAEARTKTHEPTGRMNRHERGDAAFMLEQVAISRAFINNRAGSAAVSQALVKELIVARSTPTARGVMSSPS